MKVKEYGYEYDAIRNDTLWECTRGKCVENMQEGVMLLRSGRDAIKAVAREYQDAVVLMPALSCESMVSPFQMYGHTVRFYKLTSQYRVDLGDVERQLVDDRIVLFVYMDYFGLEAVTDQQLNALRVEHPHIVFIEDRTHNLLFPPTRQFEAEYTVASLRKWCNIPDGGMLIARQPLACTALGKDLGFTEERLRAQCLRRDFFETGDQSIKTEYRHVFSSVSDILDTDKLPVPMSAYAYALVKNTDWRAIRACRQENAETLLGVLKKCAQIQLIQDQSGKSDLYVAFSVKDRDLLQQKLAKLGIFCTVIWPLSQTQVDACSVAQNTYRHMLAAPCDQRYTRDDMIYIGREITRLINE